MDEEYNIDEIINDLKVAKSIIEWNHPVDFWISIDKAIHILEGLRDGRSEKVDGSTAN